MADRDLVAVDPENVIASLTWHLDPDGEFVPADTVLVQRVYNASASSTGFEDLAAWRERLGING